MRSVLPEVEREKIAALSKKTIKTDAGRKVIEYLLSDERNFTREEVDIIIEKYDIGYMPNNILNEYEDPHEFSGRLILPVRDQYDNLVALSSRDWRPNSGMKFFHESYDKSIYLYGLNVAKEHIIKQKKAIIVEGEFDVQKLYVKGFKFTVGVMGSALQLFQIALLSRYCKEIFLIFDGDEAGQLSAKKYIEMSEERHFYDMHFLSLIPVFMPEKMDPDDFLTKYKKNDFIKLLKKSREDYERRLNDGF